MLTIIKIVIAYTVGPFISTIALITLWDKLNNKKSHPLSFIFMYVFGIYNNHYVLKDIKIIVYFIASLITVKLTYKEKISKSLNTVLTQMILSMMCELIIMLPLFVLLKEKMIPFAETMKGELIIDILLGTMVFICAKSIISTKLFKLLNKITENIKAKKKIIYTLLLLISLNFICYHSFYNYNRKIILIINTVTLLIYTIIIFYIFKIENKSEKIFKKYDNNLSSLRENEKIIKQLRINSHEHQNTIKTIKNMIEINDPNVINYINCYIKDLEKDDKHLLEMTSKIPVSGLKSLIYSKLVLMKKNKIKYHLYIDKNIKEVELEDSTIVDVCKIIGIFLDNAIEEVKENKKKNINIYLYQDDYLNIEISNNYKNLSFTSNKGKNHGYGLKLVNKILKENKSLINTRRINNDIFTQTLKIKSTN